MIGSQLARAPASPGPSGGTERRPGRRRHDVRNGLVLGALVVLMIGLVFAGPVPGPLGLLLAAVGIAAGVAMLDSPALAVVGLLAASFLRSALQISVLPSEPMVLATCALIAATGLAWWRGRVHIRIGAVEVLMAAYLAWNLVSMVWPHELAAVQPGTGESISVYRFIITGTLLPFLAFVVGRAVYRSERLVRQLVVCLLVLAGWSGAVSIIQFTGPTALVWPSYILDSPIWPGRAVGIVNQPAVNGLLLVAGFLIAMYMLQRPRTGLLARAALALCAVVCLMGVYLTYTRAVWVAFALGVVMCALFLRGARAGFALTIGCTVAFIIATWSTFTSSDRAAGGVGSEGEVEDRLNTIATSLWAIEQKPLAGWGIGRFTALNTYHHQVWDQTISFERGFGIASHENELGIGAELGLIGLALWVAVLAGVVVLLVRSVRRLPVHGIHGRSLGLLASTLFAAWLVSGFTVDLRYLDFANLIVFLIVGAAVGTADARAAGADDDGGQPLCPVESVDVRGSPSPVGGT